MEKIIVKGNLRPSLLDNILFYFSRPYVLIPLFAFLLVPSKFLTHVLAGQTEPKSGADFLNIGVGARAIGMGGAYTAEANDATSIYWNPAGLSNLDKKELFLMHSEWLLGSQYQFVGFAYPRASSSLGLGIFRLSHTPIGSRGENREVAGSLASGDQAFSLSYSRKLNSHTSFGGTIKLIQNSIGPYNASALAFDFGSLYHFRALPLSFGLSLQNLGTGLKFINQSDPLPLTLNMGLSWQALPGLSLALDVKQKIYNQKTQVSIGSEYQLFPILALRTGYLAGAKDWGQSPFGDSPLTSLAGGFGLKILNSTLDYALTPFGDLGNTHRLSLSLRF